MRYEPNWVRKFIIEFIPSSNQTRLGVSSETYKRRISVFLNWFAGLTAFVNWIFGTLVFSSTLFVGTLSAVGIISRYAASAFVCRGIILWELAGLRAAEAAGEQGISAASTREFSQFEAKQQKMYRNPIDDLVH